MNDEEQNDNSRFWYMVLIVLMMLLVMSCACGYHLGYKNGLTAGQTGRLKKSDEQRGRALKRVKIMHDTEVQGPVRYMRHYEQPRFTPAAADAWGSSVRATWISSERKGPSPVD